MGEKRILDFPVNNSLLYDCRFNSEFGDCEGYCNRECFDCEVGKYLTRTKGIEITIEESF